MKRSITTIIILFSFFAEAAGQTTILIRHADRDTAYIKDYYRKHLILRAYESTKFNNFKLIDGSDKLVYKPNDHDNFGIGFIYRFISINIGFYIPGVGKNRDIYGKTHSLDLQTHLYVHRFIIDFYGQFYRGYYLANSSSVTNNLPPGQIVTRPDIDTRDITLEVQYVFNDRRFSYNAPFYQNELQKKSAGSFLLGGGFYHFDARADSAFTPTDVNYSNFFQNYRFNKCSNTGMGINGGYGYTVVIKKMFFITEMLSLGAGFNYSQLTSSTSGNDNGKFGLGLNVSEKFAAGYSTDKYFAGITYIRLVTEDNSIAPKTWQEVNTGNFRFIVAKRLRLKKALIPKSELLNME